jgi:hypothetical protein
MTFPRLKLNMTEDDTPAEVLENRARFASGPLGKRFSDGMATPPGALDLTPEEAAEAFGRDMFARCGRNWSAMIGLATGAAMQAERDAMDDVK